VSRSQWRNRLQFRVLHADGTLTPPMTWTDAREHAKETSRYGDEPRVVSVFWKPPGTP